MTVKHLISKLQEIDDNDAVVICKDWQGGWDNIQKVEFDGAVVSIIFGGGSPFSSDRE